MPEIKVITDKKIWDDFLLNNFDLNYPFFQTWNWGEVQIHVGFPVNRYGLYIENNLAGVFSITDVNAKRGHYLHLRHGPAIKDFEKHFDSVLDFVKTLGKEKGASFIRISPLIKKYEIPQSFFEKRGFKNAPIHNMDAEICLVLNITGSTDDLLKNMRKSHRYLIKRAKLYNFQIIKSSSKDDVSLFLNLYKDFSQRKKFVAHRGILEEMDVLGRNNEALLILAKYEGKIISGVLIDFVGPLGIYHHAASDNKYRNLPANYLLIWESILEAKNRDKKYFNLFGIAPENSKNHPWTGFTLFKTGFGGERVEYLHAMDLPLNIFYWKTYMIDWITKKRKGY